MSQAEEKCINLADVGPEVAAHLNPLISDTCPSDTLNNCDAVLAFLGTSFVGAAPECTTEDAAGLAFILAGVQNALRYERDRVQYTRQEPKGTGTGAPAHG